MRPLLARPVPIEFHAVLVRIAQVNSLAHSVIGRAVECDTRADHSLQRITKLGAGWVKNCQVVKSGRARRWRRAAETFPSVKTDVVMITSGRDERGFAAVAGCKFEAKHVAIEPKRPLKV